MYTCLPRQKSTRAHDLFCVDRFEFKNKIRGRSAIFAVKQIIKREIHTSHVDQWHNLTSLETHCRCCA